jgi:hypothetical protein
MIPLNNLDAALNTASDPADASTFSAKAPFSQAPGAGGAVH